jgi:hypothetical protein
VKKKKGASFLKKVIDGANTKGSLKGMKVGDTRSEFASLINTFSAFFFLGALALVSTVYTGVRDFRDGLRARGEVLRVNEYKENMYFEAVADVLAKLAVPNIKGSSKSSLQRQLKDLDPDGRITRFLNEGGSRPDLSDMINKKAPKKNAGKKNSQRTQPEVPKAAKQEPLSFDDPDDLPAADEPYEEVCKLHI